MDVGVDNPYCVELADTMQTDMFSNVIWGNKVVFPTVIGKVSWLLPPFKTVTKTGMWTGEKTETKVPIKYNTQKGNFDLVRGDQTLHFKITMQYVNSDYHKVDVKQFEETQEDERRKKENENELETAITVEDLRNRQQKKGFAHEQADVDLEVAGAPAEYQQQQRGKREAKTAQEERERQEQRDAADDSEDEDIFVEVDPEKIAEKNAADKERAKRLKAQAKALTQQAALTHQKELQAIKEANKKTELKKKMEQELLDARKPAKQGWLARGKNYWKSKTKDEETGDDDSAESTSIAPGRSAGVTAPQAVQGQSVLPLQNPAAPAAAPAANATAPAANAKAAQAGWATVKNTLLIPPPGRTAPKPHPNSVAPDVHVMVQHSPRSALPPTKPPPTLPVQVLSAPSAHPGPVPLLALSRQRHRGANSSAGEASPSPATPLSSHNSRQPPSRQNSFRAPRPDSAHRQQNVPNTRLHGAGSPDGEFDGAGTSRQSVRQNAIRPSNEEEETWALDKYHVLDGELNDPQTKSPLSRTVAGIDAASSRSGRSASGSRVSTLRNSTTSSTNKRNESKSPHRGKVSASGAARPVSARSGNAESDDFAFIKKSPRHDTTPQHSSAGIPSHLPSTAYSQDDDTDFALQKGPAKRRISSEKREKINTILDKAGYQPRASQNNISKMPRTSKSNPHPGMVSQRRDDSADDSEDISDEALAKMVKQSMTSMTKVKLRPINRNPTDTDNFSHPAPQAIPGDTVSLLRRKRNLHAKGILPGRKK